MHTNFKHIVFVFLFYSLGCLFSFSQITPKSKDSINISKNNLVINAQDSTKTDSIIAPKELLEDIIKKKAVDYIANDFKSRKTTLYNNAELYYQDIELKAGIIIIDYKKNLAFAKGIIDSSGVYLQRPQFKQGIQESEQDSLIYNCSDIRRITA